MFNSISGICVVFILSIASSLTVQRYQNDYIAPKGLELADFFDLS